jgi:hypothetical protein
MSLSLTSSKLFFKNLNSSLSLSHLLYVQLDLEASPLRFGSQILSMTTTTCLGLTCTTRMLHHLMGIYVLSKIFGVITFSPNELPKNARYPHELPTRLKKSIQLPQLHVLPLSISLTRENT